MTFTKRALGAVVSFALVCLAAVVIHPVSAAATASCATAADGGNKKYTFSNKVFTWIVAQKDREENFSGAYETITFTVSSSATRSNSVSVTASASFSVDALWASFSASVSTDIGTSTSKTVFSSTTRQYSLASGDSYYFGQGTGRWTATASVYQCQKVNVDLYGWYKIGSGPVTGYTGLTHAVVGCKQSVTAGSFSAVLKQSC
jgi:hypothetical protein